MPNPKFTPLPGQNIDPQDYKFNAVTQWPVDVDNQVKDMITSFQGKPLRLSQHVDDRAQARNKDLNGGNLHGITPGAIPGLNGRFPGLDSGWRPIEVEHNGQQVTKLVMRGPYTDTHDAVMPVVPGNDGNPFVTTMWSNRNNDNHDTLDLNRVHLSEEFKMGKRPKRRLLSREETKFPGYQPIPHTRMKSRQRIVQQYGYPQNALTPQVAYYLPEMVDYGLLKEAMLKSLRAIKPPEQAINKHFQNYKDVKEPQQVDEKFL